MNTSPNNDLNQADHSRELAEASPNVTHHRSGVLFKGTIGLLTLILIATGIIFWRNANRSEAEESVSPIVEAATVRDGEENGMDLDSDANGDSDRGFTAGINQATIDAAEHPLHPLIELADRAIENIDQNYFDYTATLTNQVRVNGKLRPVNKLFIKIRHARTNDDGSQIPFSVYTKFLEPAANAGREVIWVDGWNEGNLVVHLTGWQNLMRIYLDPTGSMAMDGNLYPVSMIGMRNLLKQIREIGMQDCEHDGCNVKIERGLKLHDRWVTKIESIHPHQESHFEYHIARIFIDEEWGLPVGYEGYIWPEKAGGEPVLLERYFYTDVQLNVGLQDLDFDPANPEYDFPSR